MASYSPVFSAPFILYTAATPNTQFAVPAGYTAVIRQISANADLSGVLVQVYTQESEAAYGVVIWQDYHADIVVTLTAQGRWVVLEGGIITLGFTSLGGSPSGYVGGYLLRNQLT